jgi:NAD(P)H-hydrate repair Nnr-like enzyme with NAD(P)H-hydrate dehydratase domain
MEDSKIAKIIRELYWNRDPAGIKADFGKALLVGGSLAYPSAPVISSWFASLSGDGYNALAVPRSVYPIVASRAPLSVIYENLVDRDDSFLIIESKQITERCFRSYASVLFGNGVKDSQENYLFLSYLIANYENTLVIDGTGLALLAEYGLEVLKKKKKESTIILTPHLGEAAKLLGRNFKTKDPEAYEKLGISFAKGYGVYLLLKSYRSLLIDPQGQTFASDYPPTPSLGKAGSGDGLAGYLAGLLAYAAKKETVADLILFADALIHEGAALAAAKKSPGLASILSVPEEIGRLIGKAKPKIKGGQ